MDTLHLETILQSLTDNAINAYSQHGEQMLLDINYWIAKPEQQRRFLHRHSVDLLIHNHRNHLGFITQVLSSRDGSALAKALPWVYHAYHSQGVPFLYFEEELKKWKEIMINTLGKEEALALCQVYDWMLTAHDECCASIKKQRKAEFLEIDDPFLQFIIAGDHRNAYRYALEKVTTWEDFELFFQCSAQPALYQIGALWQNGDVSVSVEHLATAIINRILSALIMQVTLPEIKKRKILVTCASLEHHQIGSWMVATAFEADEWDVTFLGANAPKDAVLDFIENESPVAVIISVTMPYNIKNAQMLLKEIQQLHSNIKTIVGGQALLFFDQPEDILNADFLCSDYNLAINQLNDWFD